MKKIFSLALMFAFVVPSITMAEDVILNTNNTSTQIPVVTSEVSITPVVTNTVTTPTINTKDRLAQIKAEAEKLRLEAKTLAETRKAELAKTKESKEKTALTNSIKTITERIEKESCLLSAIEKRDSSLSNAISIRKDALMKSINDKISSQKVALSLTTYKVMQDARKAYLAKYKADTYKAWSDYKATKNSAIANFKKEMSACKININDESNIGAVVSNSL